MQPGSKQRNRPVLRFVDDGIIGPPAARDQHGFDSFPLEAACSPHKIDAARVEDRLQVKHTQTTREKPSPVCFVCKQNNRQANTSRDKPALAVHDEHF